VDVVAAAEAAEVVVEAPEEGLKAPDADAVVALDRAADQSLGSLVSPNLRKSSGTRKRLSARSSPRRPPSRDRTPVPTTCCSLVRAQLRVSLSD
jgi:hypothetical protein